MISYWLSYNAEMCLYCALQKFISPDMKNYNKHTYSRRKVTEIAHQTSIISLLQVI